MFSLLASCGGPAKPCESFCDGNQYFSCELNEFQTCRDCNLENQAPICSPPARVVEGSIITQATVPITRGHRFPYDIPFEGLGILLVAEGEVVDYTLTDSTGFYRLSTDHRGELQLVAEAHSPNLYASVVDCARSSETPCGRNFYTREIANLPEVSADPLSPTSSTWTAYEDLTVLETFDFTLRDNSYLPFIGLQRLIALHQFLESEFAYSTRSAMYYADGVEIDCDSICTYTQPRPAPDVIIAQSYYGGSPKDIFGQVPFYV